MRLREPAAANLGPQAPAPHPPVAPAQPAVAAPREYDWVSPPQGGAAGVQPSEAIAAASVAPMRQAVSDAVSAQRPSVPGGQQTPAWDPSRVQEGEVLTVTIGKEQFCPVKFNGFDVGPLAMSVTIRRGESAAVAYIRARVVLEQLLEAEMAQRTAEFIRHLDKARQQVRGD